MVMYGLLRYLLEPKVKTKWKAYFADFGRSANYNAAKKFNVAKTFIPATGKEYVNRWKYRFMMKNSIALKNHNNIEQLVMDDDNVMREYFAEAKNKGL